MRFGVAVPGIPESTILVDDGRVNGDFGYKAGTPTPTTSRRVAASSTASAEAQDFVIRGGAGLYYSVPASNIMYIKQLYGTMVSA